MLESLVERGGGGGWGGVLMGFGASKVFTNVTTNTPILLGILNGNRLRHFKAGKESVILTVFETFFKGENDMSSKGNVHPSRKKEIFERDKICSRRKVKYVLKTFRVECIWDPRGI